MDTINEKKYSNFPNIISIDYNEIDLFLPFLFLGTTETQEEIQSSCL